MGQRMVVNTYLLTLRLSAVLTPWVSQLFMVVVLTLLQLIYKKSTDSGDNWHYIDMSLYASILFVG
jgi:hypothetical protein